jgi:hypothetical protein
MTPSFEFFDLASSRRAYFSAADQERAGYLAELTQASGTQGARYDAGVTLEGQGPLPGIITVGMI